MYNLNHFNNYKKMDPLLPLILQVLLQSDSALIQAACKGTDDWVCRVSRFTSCCPVCLLVTVPGVTISVFMLLSVAKATLEKGGGNIINFVRHSHTLW